MKVSDLAGSQYLLDGWGLFQTAWIIHDIRSGSKSALLAGSGGIPAQKFATGGVDQFLELDVIRPFQSLQIEVEYVGDRPGGAMFNAVMLCSTVDEARPAREIIPINGGPFRSGERMEITSHPQRISVQPKRLRVSTPTESHVYMRLDGKVYAFTGGPRYNCEVGVTVIDEAHGASLVRNGDIAALIEPRMLTFHTQAGAASPDGWHIALWAVDERNGCVVLEAGHRSSSQPVSPDAEPDPDGNFESTSRVLKTEYILRLDIDGFEPDWMASVETSGYLPEHPTVAGPTHAEKKRASREHASKGK